jgi:Ca-activated chloride channel family protein
MDDMLDRLKTTTPPPPRDEAKAMARAAAMQAFEMAGQQENSPATQGSGVWQRLSHIATSIWRPLMHNRLMAGSALATVLVVPVAGFFYLSAFNPDFLSGQNRGQGGVLEMFSPGAGSPVVLPEPVESEKKEKRRDSALLDAVTASGRAESDAVAQEAPAPMVLGAPAVQTRQLNQLAGKIAKPDGGAFMQPVPVSPDFRPQIEDKPGDRVEAKDTNGVISVSEQPVSTFSADVDTASYAYVRRALTEGRMPQPDTVRVEELVNYFPYDYAGPDSAATPFKATVTITPTPWNADTRLLHIGVKGFNIAQAARPTANLVFLIDTSGSMQDADKLPLLKASFRLLLDTLDGNDTVSIVTYAGSAATVLEPTKASNKADILDALEQLGAGGSTAGAQGIEQAYRLAEKSFAKDGVNRVILATDGDFNVGPSSDEDLKRMIEDKRKSGVFLSILGFGQGNYNDQLMQTLAQNGNGTAAYIDTLAEAEKTLVQEATSSLFPIASDVKFQIEFNPAVIAEYRQIGFETRALAREDFNDDQVDAGDIGSGHTVTAIYEVTPVGSPAVLIPDLRYGEKKPVELSGSAGELGFLKMRAKRPGAATSELTEIAVTPDMAVETLDAAPTDVRFSIAVAAFGQKLRETSQLANYSYQQVLDLAAGSRGDDPFGYRGEFLKLVRLAKGLAQ